MQSTRLPPQQVHNKAVGLVCWFPACLASGILILGSLFAANLSARPFSSADLQLNGFFQQYLEERFVLHPFEATELGDHRFDHLLDALSPAALARSLAHTRKTLAELPRQV